MINSRKKGFTLVELVIVIAVIAILAAVLIPTFSSLVKKANLSADQQEVRQINTLLATEFATEKPETLKEVVDMLDENGYNTDALIPLTKGYSFVWNKETNTISLVLNENIDTNAESLEDGKQFINKEISNVTELQKAILDKSDVKLTANITTNKLNIPSGADITIDLNGFTLTANLTTQTDADGSSKSEYAIENNGGTVLIENSTLIAASGDKALGEGSKDTNDVYYEPQCLFITNGSVVVNNSTFECKNSGAYAIAGGDNSTIELNNCTVEAFRGGVHAETSSTITINGGKYTQLSTVQSGHLFFARGKIVVSSNTEKIYGASLQCTEDSGEILFK